MIKTNDVAFQNDDADLDIIKIKERIANDIQSITVDLALTDYDLGDEHVDGLNIIEILKEIRPNVRVILKPAIKSSVFGLFPTILRITLS